MKHRWNGLIISLALFCAAWVFASLIQVYQNMADIWRMIFVGWFAILAFGGFCVGGVWLVQRVSSGIRDLSIAKFSGRLSVLTAKKEIMLVALKLEPPQIGFLEKSRLFIDIIPGDPPIGPLYQVRLPGGDVTQEFVEEFINLSTAIELPEVRQWSGGSYKRDSAERITAYFVSEGYARPAAGNRPATWINKRDGLIAIGYLKAEGVEEFEEDDNNRGWLTTHSRNEQL